MTYKATNAELEETLERLRSIMDEKVVLPVNVIYKIIKNKLAIEQAFLPFKMTRCKIVDRYSDGKGVIKKEDAEAYEKAFAEIMSVSSETVEVRIIGISLSELKDKEMPFNMLSAIGFMIDDQ